MGVNFFFCMIGETGIFVVQFWYFKLRGVKLLMAVNFL